MTMKEVLNSLDIYYLVPELREAIVGGVVAKIYHIPEDTVILKVRSKGAYKNLVINCKKYLTITKFEFEKPKKPSAFCMSLRKYLNRSKITDITQVDFERIVRISFQRGSEKYDMYIELIREGNILLTDNEGKIISLLRVRRLRDRTLAVGEKYRLPPSFSNVTPLSPPKEIEVAVKGAKAADISRIVGLGKVLASEVLKRLGVSEKDLLDENARDVAECIASLLSERRSPRIIFEDDNMIDVVPFQFKIYEGKREEIYETFTEAIDRFFTFNMLKVSEKEKTEKLRAELEKLILLRVRQEEHLKRLLEKSSKYRRRAELIYQNIHMLTSLLNEIQECKDTSKIEELQLKYPVLKNVNFKTKTVLVELNGEYIELPIYEKPSLTANTLYDKVKKYREKAKRLRKVLEEFDARIEKLRKGVREIEDKARTWKPKLITARKWYEKFRWIIVDGFMIVAGRDAYTNEALIKKYCEKYDIVLHADIHGSPFTLIKCGRETTVPEAVLKEAALITACYSKAWREGFSAIDVYWVKPNQVSKAPPPGQYLPRGSFMIKGKKNYIRGVQLRLCIGVKVENSIYKFVIGSEENVSRNSDIYFLLVPGNLDKKIIADKILSKCHEKLGFKVDKTKLMELIPGPSRILKINVLPIRRVHDSNT
ncbi:hypothetical protein DRO02_01115 [archaeon]|nr:MAG: hypothetical protein DRO02_01115 [archaeon]RLG66026.1 MAG: hypothetical protein DRO21_00525 [archaeon]HDM23778.1 fibronectin-binding domain-containing protein [Candidatus Bathyarchaeota archaeon]